MELNDELRRFWEWAQLTSEEYEEGIAPRNPYAYLAEWETEYPMLESIEDAFCVAIADHSNFNTDGFIKLVVQAIAIDNESERLADLLTHALRGDEMDKVLDAALMSGLVDAQWQLASRVLNSNSRRKVEYLRRFQNEGKSDYVRKRAEYELQNMLEP